MQQKLVIIDLFNLLYRCHYAMAHNPLKSKTGQVTSAVFGLAQTLWQLIDDGAATHLAVVTDGGNDRRKAYYPEYKAGRKETPEDLASQFALVDELIAAFDLKVIKLPGEEADDVIGSLATQATDGLLGTAVSCSILSGDLDFVQLLTRGDRLSLQTRKRGGADQIMCEKDVPAKFGITPEKFVDYLALSGDPSDNIPGVRGIGDVTSKALLNTYGRLDDIYLNLENLKPSVKGKLEAGKDNAYLSQKLSVIVTDLQVGVRLPELAVTRTQIYNDKLKELCDRLDIRSISYKISSGMQTRAVKAYAEDNVFSGGEPDGYGPEISKSLDKEDL